MKTLTIILILLIPIYIYSQGGIISLNIQNSTSLPDDTIFLDAKVFLPNMSCALSSHTITKNGYDLVVDAIYTDGMLPAICTLSNTFNLGILSSGQYKLVFNMYYWSLSTLADKDSLGFTVGATGIDPGKAGPSMTLYPNPATGHLFIIPGEEQGGEMVAEVYDIHGKMVAAHRLIQTGPALSLPLNGLGRGIYVVRLLKGETASFTGRFVVR